MTKKHEWEPQYEFPLGYRRAVVFLIWATVFFVLGWSAGSNWSDEESAVFITEDLAEQLCEDRERHKDGER